MESQSKILIVDDEPFNVDYLEQELDDLDYQTVTAVNGRDALDKLSGAPGVCMIVTDLSMPNLDGIALIRAVRDGNSHKFIPIVMLTTESLESKKQEGKAAGATGWIVKPFRPEQLVAVVKKVLG